MKILFKIIKYILTAFLVVVLLLVVFQKITKNKLVIGNIYVFQVISESMKPEYKIGDIIIVKKTDGNELKVGDDVTYVGQEDNLRGLTITHRIVNTRENDGNYYFTTKGLANTTEDPEISINDIYGKVIYHTILFSFVGRLMTNMVIYYFLFIAIGVAFAYEVISNVFFKKEDDEEPEEKEGS